MFKKFILGSTIAASCMTGVSFGDDTELYIAASNARTGLRPQVLIIFDNSGSMSRHESTKPFFTDTGKLNDSTKLYFSSNGTVVPTADSSQFILQRTNACASSAQYLNDYGVFTGYIREYRFTAGQGRWQPLPTDDGSSIKIIDCYEDIENKNKSNPHWPDGYPVDGEGDETNKKPYTHIPDGASPAAIADAIAKSKLTDLGIGKPITLYTQEYIDWFHKDNNNADTKRRIEIAQNIISETVLTTPGVDFGLAVFNRNGDSRDHGSKDHGGRIIKAISKTDEKSKTDLLKLIDSLHAETWTPLCETMYEAYRYFSGGSVVYGKNQNRSPRPPMDSNAQISGVYKSPFSDNNCGSSASIIYITDGEPFYDLHADSDVEQLTKATFGDKVDGSYLPALASWMKTNDVNSTVQGTQTVSTYTIGFSDGADKAAEILSKTAEWGGGKYYAAKDAVALRTALRDTFTNILAGSFSFTSPSIASNNFDRTQTHDSVYFAMFTANKGARWTGNLKKFKVRGNGEIIDASSGSKKAIGADGNIDANACSYWSDCYTSGPDGHDVTKGGALAMLRDPVDRNIYSNIDSAWKIVSRTKGVLNLPKGQAQADLATKIGINKDNKDKVDDLMKWTIGIDVDDENDDKQFTDIRLDILGDPLHSKPLAINYGIEKGKPDIRLLMGTNHGFLHMFKDVESQNKVEESWAFIPSDLLSNLPILRANVPTGVHSVYGIDSPPVAYIQRSSNTIKDIWAFVGMRRGGSAYYALDITNADEPKFMWKADATTLKTPELGQTWSVPVITRIPGHSDGGVAKPVLIVGAGYSPTTKDGRSLGKDDTKGRGVLIIDAETGNLVHYFGHGASGKSAMPGIKDSIPNSVAALDSDGDGLTDRIYATDTGANIWRIDMPSANKSEWTAYKFADLGGNSVAQDRRFFAAPTVAQTIITNIVVDEKTKQQMKQDIPYDAVVVGSGNRTSPLDTGRDDYFYVLQDRNITTKSFDGTTNPVPETLTLTHLFNVTTAPANNQDTHIKFSANKGWYYNFKQAGEKSLSAATIINGKVFFTSFVPGNNSTNQCLIGGVGRLYGFDLHRGFRAYQSEYYEMSERVPDTPQLVIPPNGEGKSYMYLVGIGSAGDKMKKIDIDNNGCGKDDHRCVGGGLKASRIYYHVVE
ncbi:pilus assembly protein [Parashewanella tropica]|uniref:pilus assembly protein n=1 Tax=Parashewanella tropica TaxID=2547970 RepID=UPI0010597110|nr:PilC/PilY family type IV pilus protein [Parashewanella tropica]